MDGVLRLGLLSGAFSPRLLMMVRMRLAVVVLMVMLGFVMVSRGPLVAAVGSISVLIMGLANRDDVGALGLIFPLDEVLDYFRRRL